MSSKVKNLNLGFDKNNCCDYLTFYIDGFGLYCEKHSHIFGSINDKATAIQVSMYCGFYNRDHNCWVEMSNKIEREKKEKEEQEKAAKEKTEIERITANYADALKKNPNDAQAYAKRGSEFVSKGYFYQGIDDYDKAIQLNPSDVQTYLRRGMAYSQEAESYRQSGMACSQIKECDFAIKDFDHVLKLTPNDADVFSFRGMAYFQKKEYNKALSDFKEAILLDPKCKSAYIGLGIIYDEKGKLGLSIANYKNALLIEPNDNYTASFLKKAKERKKEAEQKRNRV